LRRVVAIAAAVAAVLAGTACRSGGSSAPAGGPPPVAVVNGEPIPRAALERELAQLRVGGGEGSAPTDVLKASVLDDLVNRALLLQQARSRGITVGQDQVDRAVLALRAEYPGTAFDDLLAQERLSVSELQARVRDQLTVEKLFREEVFTRVQVSPEEVARYHAEHAAEFDQPERVHARQIVVRTREEAAKLRDEVRRKPQSFADVASRASIAPEARRGGDLGWFGKGQGMPEVFDVTFRMSPGSISDVVPSPFGFHVFQVVEKKPASHRTLEEARPAITARLEREKRARAQEEYVAALRSRAKVQIDTAAVASVKP
jgi:peptidyl-prolyl cis-trans isomerase C